MVTPTIHLFILQPFYSFEYLILLAVSFGIWGVGGGGGGVGPRSFDF